MLSEVDAFFFMLIEADLYLLCSTKQMLISYILWVDVYLLSPRGGRYLLCSTRRILIPHREVDPYLFSETNPYCTPRGRCMSLAPQTILRITSLLRKWIMYHLHILVCSARRTILSFGVFLLAPLEVE